MPRNNTPSPSARSADVTTGVVKKHPLMLRKHLSTQYVVYHVFSSIITGNVLSNSSIIVKHKTVAPTSPLSCPDNVVLSLVGDGGFGQNPAMLATAVELNLGIIWLIMNNNAFGTIAGLQKAHYGITYGTTFPGTSEEPENGPDYSKIAEAYGAVGIKINSASELLPSLRGAIASNKPTVIDVAMINNPTPTTGHWNILDIYSPDKNVSHVST